MSSRNRPEAKKKRKAEKEGKAQVTAKTKGTPKSPHAVMKLMRVTKAELQSVERSLQQEIKQFEERVIKNIEQLWSNQNSLKGGLDMAEFHLRAYRRLIADIANQINNEGQVVMEQIDAKGQDGEDITKRVVNMKHYFTLAKAEIERLEEIEKAARAAAMERAMVDGAVKKTSAKTLEEMEEILAKLEGGEEVLHISETEFVKLTAETRLLAIEMLQDAIRVKKVPPAPEAPTAPDDGIPEGAAVFGGEHAPSDQRNEGQQETRPEEPDRGGEHRPPSELPESPVPNVQAGDGGVGSEQARPDGL